MCPSGTPTIATGSTIALLCEVNGVDCSACNPEYYLSAAAATGAQTCVGCTVCGVSQYQVSACAATPAADRTCAG